jgi:hypothetical protein
MLRVFPKPRALVYGSETQPFLAASGELSAMTFAQLNDTAFLAPLFVHVPTSSEIGIMIRFAATHDAQHIGGTTEPRFVKAGRAKPISTSATRRFGGAQTFATSRTTTDRRVCVLFLTIRANNVCACRAPGWRALVAKHFVANFT